MKGKTVVITGATSGIGQVAAEALASQGARIVFVARNPARAEALTARLRERAPGVQHRFHLADLLRLSEMLRVGREIAASEPRIDVLMNNAGALFGARSVTEDGMERTFALNHMSYFVLTECLRERLSATPGARIVNTASAAHRYGHLDFDDLQMKNGYGAFKAYGRSKLCNILFTRELARRLRGTGVVANSLHPGFVATRFGDDNGGVGGVLFRFLKLFALPPEKGAKTMVFLASSSEAAGAGGDYFEKCVPATPMPQARDDAAAARLWKESAKLAGIGL